MMMMLSYCYINTRSDDLNGSVLHFYVSIPIYISKNEHFLINRCSLHLQNLEQLNENCTLKDIIDFKLRLKSWEMFAT